MAGCCGCCKAFQPKYRRYVNQIFPADPQDGLVKGNMDKLIFFAMKSPEKLDRIADCLNDHISRDVLRPYRYGYVFIAMEALDTLLITCHGQSINVFVESYLRTIQKLLEQNDPEFQCVATSSFIKFSNIDEDIPSYHRRYDFFVSKFSSMAHSAHKDSDTRGRLRTAGLKGLQGVVRKTVSDDLQVNIWENTHMDKIIPSLLFNMSQYRESSERGKDVESPRDESDPSVVAEGVFRDVVCRASYGNINAVIRPVLMHLNNHNLWIPNDFAVKCFKIIMYSVQAQYGYVVVQMLMTHLDQNREEEAAIKASIVGVLSETVIIAAGGSIGPSVLEVFHALLRHLRQSVDHQPKNSDKAEQEEHFQEAIINTIGEFANNLPDYQKIEILMFVMGKMPMPSDDKTSSREVQLQSTLMKTLLKVATKYRTILMANAFPNAFLEPLMKMSLVHDASIRRVVQEILQTLIDRHDNTAKLKLSVDKTIENLGLTVEQSPRQDVMFMKKNGTLFYWYIFENMQLSTNKVDNYESLYLTLALICIEMGRDEIIVDLCRLALAIQNKALQCQLNITHKCAIHALVACFLHILSQIVAIPAFTSHVKDVISAREIDYPAFLPDIAFNRSNTAKDYPTAHDLSTDALFSPDVIREALSSNHYDTSLLSTAFHPPQPTLALQDNIDSRSRSELASVITDFDSPATTPPGVRKLADEITFESLKKVLETAHEEEEKANKRIYESFKTGPFEDIVAKSHAQADILQNEVNKILDMIGATPEDSPLSSPRHSMGDAPALHTITFPELFVY